MKKSGADRLKESKERKEPKFEKEYSAIVQKRGESFEKLKKQISVRKKKMQHQLRHSSTVERKKELPIKLKKLYLLLLRKGRQCFQQCWKVQQHARL